MTCDKIAYTKKGAATARNERTRGRQGQRRHRPAFLRAYECPVCGAWHLTHKRNWAL